MAASDKIVVDASVALKWFFDDEPDIAAARDLLAKWERLEIDFIVAPHFPFEVLNAIRSGIIKGRITAEQAHVLAGDFLDLALESEAIIDMNTVFSAAVELGRSVYDTAYVILAESRGIDFVTGDRKLYNAIAERRPFVRYVGKLS